MLVFRDSAGRSTLASRELRDGLKAAIRARQPLETLLRAGELECSLAELGILPEFASVTNAAARALLWCSPSHTTNVDFHDVERRLAEIAELPVRLEVRAPEGFCYYALHPLSFVLPRSVVTRRAAVVGIRSIGTTLSAVTSAALDAPRITVRPTGHPYDRRTQLAPAERAWVQQQAASGAEFYVVDEGPGLSGSSLLSVGESLMSAGIAAENIILVCSREPQPEKLVTERAVERWARFRTIVVSPHACEPPDGVDLPGLDWRSGMFPDQRTWPGRWTQMTVPQMRSRDGQFFYKFEGFGRYGDEVRRRSEQIAAAEFGPPVSDAGHGWSAYAFIPGDCLHAHDLEPDLIDRLAEYTTFRTRAFGVSDCDEEKLTEMASFNAEQLWGVDLGSDFRLTVERPVIADGRMMPYEWRGSGGCAQKLDAAMHGDNHFFPGPVDCAWDLAGAIVEWQMNAAQREAFLRRYQALSGDDAENRIAEYVIAYCAFQAGYAQMAAAAMAGTAEEPRLRREAERYTYAAQRLPITV
jgi:hypothetical protein